jgi:hypothetical protein
MNEDEWAAAMDRFGHRLKYLGIAATFRVELQKRKVPHLHGVAWLDSKDLAGQEAAFEAAWLKSVREHEDRASRRYAVRTRQIRDEGWLVYVALHDGKHKREQLGWKGKQWGVWGRQMFRRREANEWLLTDRQNVKFVRTMRRLVAVKKTVVGKLGGFAWDVHQVQAFISGYGPMVIPGGGTTSNARTAWRCHRRAGNWRCVGGRQRVLPMNRAWLRCFSSQPVERLLSWVTS